MLTIQVLPSTPTGVLSPMQKQQKRLPDLHLHFGATNEVTHLGTSPEHSKNWS